MSDKAAELMANIRSISNVLTQQSVLYQILSLTYGLMSHKNNNCCAEEITH